MSTSAALVTQASSKVFFPRTINEVVALNDISLRVHPGDFITIIGSNGSGKSTLLNTDSRHDSPHIRQRLLDGDDITKQAEHSQRGLIGRVFQDPRAGTAPHVHPGEHGAWRIFAAARRGLRPGVSKKRKGLMQEQLAGWTWVWRAGSGSR